MDCPALKDHAALTALAKAKVPRSVFKAVVTRDNIGWTLAQLGEELSRSGRPWSRARRRSIRRTDKGEGREGGAQLARRPLGLL